MKNKSSNNTKNLINYIRTKDAYDGNMELTNLKSVSQKLSVNVDNSVNSSSEDSYTRKNKTDGE